ncbi:MAG: hypothetical protein KBT00_02650 [Bacteroidales bacterium]|nr:hypothetical protein [Candidatus Cacconaster merdequi]
MKKYLLLLSFAALLFAGCDKEQFEARTATDGEMVEASFTAATTDAVISKATIDNDGQGAFIKRWIMEVRDASGAVYSRKVENETAGTLQHTFKVKLFKNQQYTFAFWADNGGEYFDVTDLRAVTFNDATANLDEKDAFSAVEKNLTFTESFSKTIILYRPFAQLNVITTDLNDLFLDALNAGAYNAFKPKNFKATLTLPSKFNVLTEEASEEGEVELTAGQFYGKGEQSYENHPSMATMFMAYVFASKDEKDPRDIKFKFEVDSQAGSNEYEFTAVPLQRNYRTNIIGNLLSGNAEWNVIINPDWEDEYIFERWSEGMITAVTPDNDGIYNIARPSELAWIAQQVNSGNTFAGKTVKLLEDIDLNNGAWTPIGKSDVLSFKGTFDGNDKIIKNLNVNLGNSDLNAGLFSFVSNAVVKNFTIDGAKVSVVGGAAGVVAGKMFPGGLIENVGVKNAELAGCRQMGGIIGSIYGKVKNCKAENIEITAVPNWTGSEYDNGDKCGAIVGFSAFDNDGGEISNSIAKNVVIKGYRDLGGIVGAADCSKTTIKDNQVLGAEITADQTINSYGKKDYNVGAIVGRVNAGSIDASNTSEGVITKTIGNAVEKALSEAAEGETVTITENTSNITIPATLAENVTLKQAENVVVEKISIPAGADIKGLVLEEFTPNIAAIDNYDFSNGFVDISKDAKVENLLIKNCSFTGPNSKNRTAIFIQPSETAQPKTIEIENCTCQDIRYFIYTNGQIPGTTIKVTNCEVTNMYSWAIMINNGNIAGIDVQNCTFSGGDIVKALDGNKDPDFKFTFKNNTITGNTANFSLKAKAENTFISGNTKGGTDWNPTIGVL